MIDTSTATHDQRVTAGWIDALGDGMAKDYGFTIRWKWVEYGVPWIRWLQPKRCSICSRWHLLGRGRTVKWQRDYPAQRNRDLPFVHACSQQCLDAAMVAKAALPEVTFMFEVPHGRRGRRV